MINAEKLLTFNISVLMKINVNKRDFFFFVHLNVYTRIMFLCILRSERRRFVVDAMSYVEANGNGWSADERSGSERGF